MKKTICCDCKEKVIPCEYAIPENDDISYRCPNCGSEMSQQVIKEEEK